MKKIKDILLKYIDILTGESSVMMAKYKTILADNGFEKIIDQSKRRTKLLLLAIAGLLLLLFISSLINSSSSKSLGSLLEREGVGGNSYSLPVEITADYGDVGLKEDARLNVLPKTPTKEESELLIKEIQLRLANEILGENITADNIISDLNLPLVDLATGADISWSSSNEEIITEDGKLRLLGANKDEVVVMTAYIRLTEASGSISIALKIGDVPVKYDFSSDIKQEVRSLLEQINEDSEGSNLILPDKTANGIRLAWNSQRQDNHIAEILGICLIGFFVFKFRYKSLEKHLTLAKNQMAYDFPEFIEKLSLLLGAGLVVTSAIERIIDDYCSTRRKSQKRHLYEELIVMKRRMEESNSSLIYEFSDVARRSGIREIMRFNSVLSDNIGKGSVLSEKLDAEREMLWDTRKKNAEKEGRIAETKLIFPMVMQLLVIIGITVIPAALEM